MEMTKEKVLADISERKKLIQFQMDSVRMQLNSVDKRINSLKKNIFFYGGYLLIPIIGVILLLIIIFVSSGRSVADTIVAEVFAGFWFAATIVYVLLLPAFVYHLVKNIILYQRNDVNNEYEWNPPKAMVDNGFGMMHRSARAEEEPYYIVEKRKLLWVMNQYSVSMLKLDELLLYISKDITSEEGLEDVDQELKSICIYEDIIPARIDSSKIRNDVAPKAIMLTLLFIAFILFLILGVK